MQQGTNIVGTQEQPDRDVLITRLLDARAGESDWAALRDLAGTDRAIWDELIESCRQQRRLERGFESVTAGVGSSEMPPLAFTGSRANKAGRGAFLGWAAAAVLALGLVAQQAGLFPVSRMPGNTGVAGILPVSQASPQELLQQYINSGRERGVVVCELPDQHVVETRETEGGHEVFFVRQLLERALVTDDAFRSVGVGEDGRPLLVKGSAPTIAKAKY